MPKTAHVFIDLKQSGFQRNLREKQGLHCNEINTNKAPLNTLQIIGPEMSQLRANIVQKGGWG